MTHIGPTTTSPEQLLLGFGRLLLVAGVLGRDVQMRELTIPPIGRFARVCAPAASSPLPAARLAMYPGHERTAPPQTQAAGARDAARAERVRFTVTDELTGMQLAEDVALTIDGRDAGALHVDLGDPDDPTTVEVHGEGPHRSSRRRRHDGLDADGVLVERHAAGGGTLHVRDGASCAVQYAESGDSCDAVLVEG